MIKKVNKRGQFYLIATIVIVGIIIGLIVTFNYLNQNKSDEAKEISKELAIESEKVLDYDTFNSKNEFENFSAEYSSYIGADKNLYFIIIEGVNEEAYKYTDGVKIDYSDNLSVEGNTIEFIIEDETYFFELEEGKNFYFVLTHEIGGEKYVFSG